jgi:TonB-linked SusC/RagA family outer membrane protein
MNKFKIYLAVCALAASAPYYAGATEVSLPGTDIVSAVKDNITVTGQVTDEEGNPLAGVTVTEKGTTNSTLTSADGNYTFTVSDNATLLFSLAKYKTETVILEGASNVPTVVLRIDKSETSVNVAFRQAEKSDILGGVASVDIANVIDHNYFTNTMDRLYTYVSGYNGATMWGIGDMLTLVDGVPRALDNVMPNEIESITFLKGAQAVNLYGSRGAKGAILVTTKRGEIQPLKITVRANEGIFVDKRYPEYMGAAEYMTYYNQARKNDGMDPLYSDEEIYYTAAGKNPYRYPDVNLYSDEYIKKVSNRYDAVAEINGGSEFARYYSNISYYGSDDNFKIGEAKNSRVDRLAVRGNVDMNFNEYITAGVDADITMYNAKGTVGKSYWSEASTMRPNRISPFIPTSYINSGAADALQLIEQTDNIVDGKFLAGTSQDMTNVFADMYCGGKSKNTIRQFQFDFKMDFDLSKLVQGLSFHTVAALDYNTSYRTSFDNTYAVFTPTWSNVNGADEIVDLKKENIDKKSGVQNVSTNYNNRTTSVFAHFDYDRKFGNHTVGAMILANGWQRVNSGSYHSLSNANLGLDLRYDFAKRYFAQFTASTPYSAKLPENNRAGFSPSVSLGWNISNEDFFTKGFISSLMLSVSASDLKEDIDIDGYYLYNGAYQEGGWFSWGDNGQSAIQSKRGDNPDLGFIHRKELSANLRMGMMEDKITLDFSAFNNVFTGLIYSPSSQYPSYFSYGYPDTKFIPNINFNEDQRKGFDLGINYKDTFGEVKVQGGVNLTCYKAIAKKRDDSQYENKYQYREGTNMDEVWGYECLGYFTSQAEIDASPSQAGFGTIKPGDLKYKDQNGDNIIDSKDQVDLGKRYGWYGAPYSLGFNLSGSYKNFTLLILGYADTGYYDMVNSSYYYPRGDNKYSANARDTWTEQNQNAKYPRLTTGDGSNNTQASDFWLRKMSLFHLSRVQLTYDFPESMFANNRVISAMSVYLSGSSLLTISKEKEYIETSIGYAPQTRFYNLGVKLTF